MALKIITTILAIAMAFIAGWFVSSLQTQHQLQRLVEEREAATSLAEAALTTSDKALSHSVTSAETLIICLTKLGVPTLRGSSLSPGTSNPAGLARVDP